MSLLGFDALGRLALGQIRSGGTVTQFNVTAGSFAITGSAATFTILEAVSSGAFALTGVSGSFTVKENAAAGAFSIAGQAASFYVIENPVAGAFLLNGSPVVDSLYENVQAGAFVITGNDAPMSRTGGDDIDHTIQYGGIGHYKLELERARQLAKITRKIPPPIDRTTRPQFASIGSPPIAPSAPLAPAPEIQNQRMADVASASALRKRRETEALLLLAC